MEDARHDLHLRIKAGTDGCANVFVDAGANIGVHTRFLFEPERYRHSLFVHTFTRVFGSIDRRANTTCSIGFEPNPKHVARHEALQRAYAQKGWRYTFIPAALGTSSGELTFYTNGAISAGSQHEDWGFGVTDRVGRCEHDRNCRANVLLNGTLHAVAVRVPSVSFDAVLAQISRRRIPHEDLGGRHPKVLIKMDIEGAEFEAIPAAMLSGQLCHTVDYISVEWHARLAPLALMPNQSLDLRTEASARATANVLRAAIRDGVRAGRPSCRTELDEVDDETYVHDGVPLPE